MTDDKNSNRIRSTIDLGEEFTSLNGEVWIVGGAVRDALLGNPSNDIDLMVTGVEPATLENRGFDRIDATSFPVFHDSAGREVALPRTEQSTGAGHTDFDMHVVSPDLSDTEAARLDLKRRDLTINAMAFSLDSNELLDPFGGKQDLHAGIVRHVSDAFTEDPLRVVRAARFSARFNFDIAPETLELMRSTAPKLHSLPDDRFGDELIKALKQADSPRRFFDILADVGALEYAYPELAQLRGAPAGPDGHHLEGDAFEHTMWVLETMYDHRRNDVDALLAALAHDLGKGVPPEGNLANHYGHARRGATIAQDMRERLALERDRRGIMDVAARHHMRLHVIDTLDLDIVIDTAEAIASSPLSVEQVAALQEADAAGRKPCAEDKSTRVRDHLSAAVTIVEDIGGQEALDKRDIDKSEIGDTIDPKHVPKIIKQDRVEALRRHLHS